MQKKSLSKENFSVGRRSRVSRHQKLRSITRVVTFKLLFKILESTLIIGKIAVVIRDLRR
ncbi:hypothetical protein [Paenibacillus odorifer]|uniref:hypothetical protein n=1 Tax=Paenibacillus odorifer TaxID=189426 RepID=UPI0020BDCC4F|nr:hypothetical protein [Paenibacillus odorifer]